MKKIIYDLLLIISVCVALLGIGVAYIGYDIYQEETESVSWCAQGGGFECGMAEILLQVAIGLILFGFLGIVIFGAMRRRQGNLP